MRLISIYAALHALIAIKRWSQGCRWFQKTQHWYCWERLSVGVARSCWQRTTTTTIHEVSAAYTVSTSSFTRGDHQATHAIFADSMTLLQKVKTGMGSPDWTVSMINHLQKFLWLYCPGHARVKGKDQTDRLADKATLTSGLLLRGSEVLRSFRH